jgi:hypothetical protein
MATKNSSAKLASIKADEEIISASKISWAAVCDRDTFALEYERFFEQLSRIDGQYYVIVRVKSKEALAFVDIVSSANGPKTKLLKLTVSPSVAAKDVNALRELYIAAMEQTFSISNTNKTKSVKFYGRTAEMLELLVEINELWNKNPLPDGLKSRMAGRWLEIYR